MAAWTLQAGTRPEPPFVLLEDRLDRARPARLYASALRVIRCDEVDGVEAALVELEAALQDGLHAAGFLSYELGHALEPRLAPLTPTGRSDPLIWMGLFDAPQTMTAAETDAAFAALPPPPPLTGLDVGHEQDVHAAKVRQVLALIAAGDIYQANLTFPIRFRYPGDPLALYAALRARQPTHHGAVVATGEAWALSVSPELFLRIEGEVVECRPMKGTAPRPADPLEDAQAREALVADPKQRAENLMITDLIRNDLARICAPGSVRTPRLFTAETHPTFHALTSTVTGRLRPGVGLRERLAAVFPCGSIVGAPKIRAAEVLAGLEAGARSLYTGAIGAFAPNGDVELSVAIRTAVLRPDGFGVYGVGGGVVADSDPYGEYDEARLKGRVLEALAEDYRLIETFRWSATAGFVRLPRHLDRLQASADALGFSFDRMGAEERLARSSDTWRDGAAGDLRVRLALERSGVLAIEDGAAPAGADGLAKIGVAAVRLDAADPFLRHKTTRRALYDAAAAEAAAAGWDEAVILNTRGEVADGSRSTVFVARDGRLLTPPLASGALPGVLRAELIAEGRAAEAVLTPANLQGGDVYIGNSLRGLAPATLAGASAG